MRHAHQTSSRRVPAGTSRSAVILALALALCLCLPVGQAEARPPRDSDGCSVLLEKPKIIRRDSFQAV